MTASFLSCVVVVPSRVTGVVIVDNNNIQVPVLLYRPEMMRRKRESYEEDPVDDWLTRYS